MTDYRKYINALRKCAKEHDNDITSTGYIIVSDLCRDTANLLELLEQEPILDKIKAEIEQRCCITVGPENDPAITLYDVLHIIDKYRTESEENNAK